MTSDLPEQLVLRARRQLQPDEVRAMLRGYQDVRPLSDAECDAIPVLAAGSAMRFFLTRLYDWIHTPPDALVSPKDPMEYWSICAFTSRSRKPPTAIGL